MKLLTQWLSQNDYGPYSELDSLLVHVVPPAISILLYGCYLPLFIACMLIVYRRKRKAYKIQMGVMLLLALASTVSVIMQSVNQGRALLALWGSEAANKGDSGTSENIEHTVTSDYAVLGIYIFSNVVADALLLYRCFVIWQKDLRVLSLPLLAYLCNIILGILGLSYDAELVFEFWILAVVENAVLTALITGKIWCIKREAGNILGSAVKIKYNMIAAIILESGFVYSAIVLATALTSMMPHNAIYASCLFSAAIQVVGIAPCLIVIRVALGVDTRDVLSSIATMTDRATTTNSEAQHTTQESSELQNVADSDESDLEDSRFNGSGDHEPCLGVEQNNESSFHTLDDMPLPRLTPNAQRVDFARLDTAVLGLGMVSILQQW